MTDYQKHIKDALASLENVRNQLFDNVINVGMYGAYSDLNEAFEPGDSYIFELDHFDGTNDPNLQNLVNLQKYIDLTSQRLLQLNNLAIEDVDLV